VVLVLGIESTCDETACAIVKDGKEILTNVVASQVDLHQIFGGVVPELACRRHIDVIIPVIDQALKEAKVALESIDVIAVAKGPGLIGALLIGMNVAKALALTLQKPLIGVNHVEAHLYAAIMSQPEPVPFPCLGVVISGGHTSLIEIKAIGDYRLIGQTTDDAIGEAFDKVAHLLSLPYPGGPNIEALAKSGNPARYPFKAGMVKGRPLDFSFSGLKTNVLYAVKGQSATKHAPLIINEDDKKDVAASFQHVALMDVVKKTLLASQSFDSQAILLGGGVSNNRYLRMLFENSENALPIFWPSQGLSLDNAAMIAGLGYHSFLRNPQCQGFDLDVMTRLPF
jgi:N6-L-threonylcarbamoyladenine synthase